MSQSGPNWPPLESNPEILTKFARQGGLPEGKAFGDVFGLDDELLMMVPQPCHALIFLFPSKAKVPFDESKAGKKASFFLRQISQLDEACGTIAMVHAIANNTSDLGLADGPIHKYIEAAKGEDPEKRGSLLANNNEIASLHTTLAQQGQSALMEDGKSADHHFVCFTAVDGNLYEFDGLKPSPTDHGALGESPFLQKAAAAIKSTYLAPHPEMMDFAMISLAAPSEF